MKLIYASVAALLVAAAVPAAEQTQPAVAVDLYQGPRGIDLRAPPYPESERKNGADGWVIVEMMIDPEGKPYELSVADSTGNPVFEKAALEKMAKSRFQPATMNGTPIHAGTHVKVQFQLSGEAGMRAAFAKLYKDALKAIEQGERESADSRLARLEARNLYEYAYRGIAQYMYCRKWCDESQQLAALRRAIAGETTARYLSKEVFASMLQAMLSLEIRVQDYARALQTWETLNENGLDDATRAKWQKSIEQIETLRTSDKAYAVAGDFGEQSSWFFDLLKRKFQVEVASGSIAEIKLRCDRQYVFFHFDPTLQYSVTGNDQGCSLEMVGQPGTKFRLIQL
jgi:TonB family protein